MRFADTDFTAVQEAGTAARLQRRGLGLLTAQAGLAALGAVLCSSAYRSLFGPRADVTAAVPVHWDRFMAHAGSQSELFAEFRDLQPTASAASAPSGSSHAVLFSGTLALKHNGEAVPALIQEVTLVQESKPFREQALLTVSSRS